jgi:hypothetical protein
MKIVSKNKTKGIRAFIARQLFKLAEWIRPGSDEGKAYLANILMEAQLEALKHGVGGVKVSSLKSEEVIKIINKEIN